MQVLAVIFGIILIGGLCVLIGFQVFNLVRAVKNKKSKKLADNDETARKE